MAEKEPFEERRYKPIIGGVRHLTGLAMCPPKGRWVHLLCGDMYKVPGGGRQPNPQADCSECHRVRKTQQEESDAAVIRLRDRPISKP